MQLPQIFGAYHLLELIGQGGQASVYRAEDLRSLERINVAVKILSPRFEDPTFQTRFEREVEILSTLDHPHILPLRDYGKNNVFYYLVTPYLRHGSLAGEMQRRGWRFSVQEVYNLALPLLQALDYAHAKGCIHRDINPNNILLDDHSLPVLSDFGLAKLLQPSTNDPNQAHISSFSLPIMGTLPYMSFEQRQGQPTKQSDIYSVGVVLYEMLAGPLQGTLARRNGLPRSPREINPAVSPEMEHLLFKALQQEQSARYQSAAEFLRDLRTAQARSWNPISGMPTGPIPPSPFAHPNPNPPPPPETPPTFQHPTPLPRLRSRKKNAALLSLLVLLLAGTILGSIFLWPGSWTSWVPALRSLFPISHTIFIATDFPISGNDPTDGLPVQDGVNYAISVAANAIPGYTIQVQNDDDVGRNRDPDPDKGVQNVTNAINNALIAGMIGPLDSSIAAAEIPTASAASFPLISPTTTNPCLTKDIPTLCTGENDLLANPDFHPNNQDSFFRLAATDDIQGSALANFLWKKKGYRTVFIFENSSDLYSDGLATAFKDQWQINGGTVNTQNEPDHTSEATYHSALEQLTTPPDVIFFSGLTPDGTLAREAMITIPSLQSTAFAVGDASVVDSFASAVGYSGGDSSPIYGTKPVGDPGSGFRTLYNAAGHQDYRLDTAAAYDATMILIAALKKVLQSGVLPPRGTWDAADATPFRQSIVAALKSIPAPGYAGYTGNYSFDPTSGDNNNPIISIYQLEPDSGSPQWVPQPTP